MTVEVGSDLVTSLGVIRGNVVHHLAGVSRYRALRNVEQTITDIAEFQDLVAPLRDVREQIAKQLEQTREYRALCAIDGIMPQLNDVLAYLDEKSNFKITLPDPDKPVATETGPETPSQIRAVYTDAGQRESVADVVAFADTASETQSDSASQESGASEQTTVQPEAIPESADLPAALARDGGSDDGTLDLPPNPETADDKRPGPDSMSEDTPSPPVAMLVQSVKPSVQDKADALTDTQATAANPDHAREDRAA